MPPKKTNSGASKKAEVKKKEKVIEVSKTCTMHIFHKNALSISVKTFINFFCGCAKQDKTFGLKNKKGGKSQKFIAQVEKQVKSGGLHPLQPTNAKKEEKEKKLKEQKELLALFRLIFLPQTYFKLLNAKVLLLLL